MGHSKVYGTCENLCRVEVLDINRSQALNQYRLLSVNKVKEVYHNTNNILYGGWDTSKRTKVITLPLLHEIDITAKVDSGSDSEYLYRMFDGKSTTSHGDIWTNSTDYASWTALEFSVPIKINKFYICCYDGTSTVTACSTIQVEGSNDNSNWTPLTQFKTIKYGGTNAHDIQTISMSNSDYFKYYRLRQIDYTDHTIKVCEWQIGDYEIEIYKNYFELDDYLFNAENVDNIPHNQMLLVETPDLSDTINVTYDNYLNGIQIRELLGNKKMYDLIWNDSNKMLSLIIGLNQDEFNLDVDYRISCLELGV